jgi:hypothetical protein
LGVHIHPQFAVVVKCVEHPLGCSLVIKTAQVILNKRNLRQGGKKHIQLLDKGRQNTESVGPVSAEPCDRLMNPGITPFVQLLDTRHGPGIPEITATTIQSSPRQEKRTQIAQSLKGHSLERGGGDTLDHTQQKFEQVGQCPLQIERTPPEFEEARLP